MKNYSKHKYYPQTQMRKGLGSDLDNKYMNHKPQKNFPDHALYFNNKCDQRLSH